MLRFDITICDLRMIGVSGTGDFWSVTFHDNLTGDSVGCRIQKEDIGIIVGVGISGVDSGPFYDRAAKIVNELELPNNLRPIP